MRHRLLFYGLLVSILCLFLFFLLSPAPMTPSSRAGSLTWLDLDGPWGGPAQALSLNPDYPADPVVFAGGGRDLGRASWSGQGIFRSNDGGQSWPVRGGPENSALFDVSLSTNWRNDGYALAAFWLGLWSTSNRGDSWQQLSSMETGGPLGITAVAVGPTLDGARTLLAGGAYGGIWRSANSGATWSFLGQVSSVSALGFQPTNMQVALAASSNGVWRSSNAGLTWSSVTSSTQVFDLAFRPGGREAYATFDSHIWRSDDGGLTWQRFTDLTVPYLNPIGVSADGAGLFTAVNGTIFRYEANASSFVTVTTNLATSYILRLAPSPTYAVDHTLLLSTFDGVYISHDRGETFVRSHGFHPLYVVDLQAAPDYASGGDLYASGSDGVWRRRGDDWQPVNSGIVGSMASSVNSLAISPAYVQDGTLFVSQSSSVSIGASLYRSTDRGESWQWIKGSAYIIKVAVSPNFASDRRVYLLADQRVHGSTDAGESWSIAPVWTFTQTAQLMELSPNFAANQTIYAVGSNVYRSSDAGESWQAASAPPPITASSEPSWQPRRLAVAADDTLFLAISRYEMTPPYQRHDQLWTSSDGGDTWSQVSAAPDRPVADLTVSQTDDALTLSTFDDNPTDEFDIAPDLFRSSDRGATWQNLGAIPNGLNGSKLLAPPGLADTLLVGGRGVWQLSPSSAPTATPDPCRELLLNRSFEYDGVWRIPTTGYSALRSLDRHSHGYWSMRTGIVDAADNRRSYSDFSQDVVLPDLPSLTLRVDRWPQAGAAAQAASTEQLGAILAATTLDEFQAAVEASAVDLQYAMVIAPPAGAIHFLYAGLDNDQQWLSEEFDLAAYRGQTVRLQFGTFNNGAGPLSAQFFDNMHVQVCSAAPPTPTETPTTGATPISQTWLPVILRSGGGGTIPPPIGE